jgi:hypothetical protein
MINVGRANNENIYDFILVLTTPIHGTRRARVSASVKPCSKKIKIKPSSLSKASAVTVKNFTVMATTSGTVDKFAILQRYIRAES